MGWHALRKHNVVGLLAQGFHGLLALAAYRVGPDIHVYPYGDRKGLTAGLLERIIFGITLFMSPAIQAEQCTSSRTRHSLKKAYLIM